MRLALRPLMIAGGLAMFGPTGIGMAGAQGLMPPSGTIAEQRQWLLQQVQMGEATGRQALIEDALARLRMLAPGDRVTLLAILEVQLSQQKLDDATQTLQRMRTIGAGSRELFAAERLWRTYQGDLQDELQQARLLATGGRREEALVIYRRLFDDDPPGVQLGIEYWRLRGAQPSGRALAIAKLAALDREYPGNTSLLQILSQLLFDAGRDGEALAALQRIAANPETRALAAQLANDRTVRRPRDFIARNPGRTQLDDARKRHLEYNKRVSDPSWRSGMRGQALLNANDNSGAELAFREALKGYPRESDFLGGLGMALMRQGRRAQALDYFHQAQRNVGGGRNAGKWRDLIASTSYWLLLEQADAALADGDPDHAATLYRQAAQRQPREVNAMLGLADVEVARGDDGAAERQLLAAQRVAPRDAGVIRRLVRLYGRTDPDRLEAFIAAQPAAQRQLYTEDLRQLRIRRLQQRLDLASEQGDSAQVIALGRQLRRQLAGDPWLAYRLANELQAVDRGSEGDAVMADMLAHAGVDPAARYAQALYLSGSGRAQLALDVLAQTPPAQSNDDMRALDARLRRQQLIDQVWDLHGQGRESEAIALLRAQPPSAENLLILADWARQRGDSAQAEALYARVLDEQPGNVDARLGQVQSWIATGELARARQAMASLPPVADDAIGRQRQLVGIWTDLHEDARALAILRQLIARKHAPDAQSYRDAARLRRRDDPGEALDLYALAMQDDGLLSASQARPRDDRMVSLASRENAQDDWLRRSIRSDVETLYQQQNPTLTVMQDSARRSDGTPGLSRLARDTRIVHLDLPIAEGSGFVRVEQESMDARRFETDAEGVYDQDFGTCRLDLVQADGTRFRAPGCNTHVRQRLNSGAGLAAGWRNLDDTFRVDIGHTPSGYEVGNWLGGVTVGGDLGVYGWSATASRRPMTNSLLSQAGAVDPRTGTRWGGVTANGVTFSLGYDRGGRNGVWSNWSWHRLLGKHVADNDRVRAMAGWYHKIIQRPDLRLDAGVTVMYWRYQRDLGGYSLGQGGYYSPQQYSSVSFPVSFAWRNSDWSVRVDASVSWSRARTDSVSRYPLGPLMDRLLARLSEEYGPVRLDETTLYTGDSSSSGTGYRLYAAVERRLGDHFVLGAAGTLQRSRDFSPNTFQLYLRYTFKPWQGNLPLPVSPLVPYGEFR